MRQVALVLMVAGFVLLALNDLLNHNYRTGIAAALLVVVQLLFYWKGI